MGQVSGGESDIVEIGSVMLVEMYRRGKCG